MDKKEKKKKKKEREKERKITTDITDYMVESKNELRWKFQQKKSDQYTYKVTRMTNNPTNITAKRSICHNEIEKLLNEGIALHLFLNILLGINKYADINAGAFSFRTMQYVWILKLLASFQTHS